MFVSAFKRIKNFIDPEKTGSASSIKNSEIQVLENCSSVLAENDSKHHQRPSDLSFLFLSKFFSLSVRLTNVIKSEDFPFRTIEEYNQADNPSTMIRKAPRCGNTTLEEFEKTLGLTAKLIFLFSSQNNQLSNLTTELTDKCLLSKIEEIDTVDPEFQELQREVRYASEHFGTEHVLNCIEIANNALTEYDSYKTTGTPDASPIYYEDKNLKSLLAQFSFPECMYSYQLSTRLDNVLKNATCEKSLEKFFTLEAVAYNYQEFKARLSQVRNYGRKSSEEFDNLFSKFLIAVLEREGISKENATNLAALFPKRDYHPNEFLELTQIVSAQLPELSEDVVERKSVISPELPLIANELNEDDCKSEEFLLNKLKSTLTSKDLDIISKRYGLFGNHKHTLEEIALEQNVTRERIRQLQNGIMKKKLKPFHAAYKIFISANFYQIANTLFENEKAITDTVFQNNIKKLSSFVRFAINMCYDKELTYFKKHHIKVKNSWIRGDTEPQECEEIKQEIIQYGGANKKLQKELHLIINSLSWPIDMNTIYQQLSEFSPDVINKHLISTYEGRIEEGKLVRIAKGLDANEKILIVFRTEKKALPPEDVTEVYNKLFQESISSGSISNYLGSHPDALIVSRGLYNIYENLHMNDTSLENIRDECYDYLNKRDVFISAGVMYKNLYLGKHHFGPDFNKYMLYGILQDDPRFIYKRGLMVGLKHFSEDSFVSLTETLVQLVKERGPITVKEIQQALSEERSILDVTVAITLDSSPECVKIGRSTYDYISNVFGSESALENLSDAIKLSVIEGPKTITAIKNNLKKLDLYVETYPLISWIDKLEDVNRSRKIVELSEFSADLEKYNNEVTALLKSGHSLEDSKNKLVMSQNPLFARMAKLDTRFNAGLNHDDNSATQEVDELDKILGDFGF